MDYELLKVAGKYGVTGIIAIYVVYLLGNIVTARLDSILTLATHSDIIHVEMLGVLREIRDQRVPIVSKSYIAPFPSTP